MGWRFFIEVAMSLGWAGFGLILDMVGVCLLFVTTSTKHIEAELVFNEVKTLTDKMKGRRQAGELVELSELDSREHKRRLSRTEQIVRRNRCWMQIALALVVAGFFLQLIEVLVRP